MAEVKSTSIRIDAEVKQRAAEVFAGLGMSFSTGVEVCLRAVIRANGLPFDMTLGQGTGPEGAE